MPIEGNGQRGSHRGDGYGVSGDPMFTLNKTEHHAVGNCLNGWDVQSKHIYPEDGIAESLYAGECRYGGGEAYCLQGNVIDRDTKQNGCGASKEVSATQN